MGAKASSDCMGGRGVSGVLLDEGGGGNISP